MATYTPNFNLKKPGASDFYSIDDFNGNMDKIDTQLDADKDNLDTHIANLLNHIPITTASASPTNTYTATLPVMSPFVDGQPLFVKFLSTNTDVCTLNVNGTGAYSLRFGGIGGAGAYIPAGYIKTNHWCLVVYTVVGATKQYTVLSSSPNLVDLVSAQTLLNKTLAGFNVSGDANFANNNIWFPKDPSAINMLPDHGRFAGNNYDPTVVTLTNSFSNPTIFSAYNGATVTSGGKFIHDNTDNGGVAGNMTTDAVDLMNAMAVLDPNRSKRYGPEFYIANYQQGSGTAAQNTYNTAAYGLFLNEAGSKALGGTGSGYITCSFWVRLKSGTGLTINKSKKLYKNGVEITDNYVTLTSADGWVHIQTVITTNGYVSSIPYLYASPNDVVQMALPVVTTGGFGVGIHTAPILGPIFGYVPANVTDLNNHINSANAHFPSCTTTGSAYTYAATVSNVASYYDGLKVWVTFNITNASGPTLNLNGLGAKNIYNFSGTTMDVSGILTAGSTYLMMYSSALGGFIPLTRTGVDVDTQSVQTLKNKTMTTPVLDGPKIKSGTAIYDANGNILIKVPTAVTSPVNYLGIVNAATGGKPTLYAAGTDPVVGLSIQTQAGVVDINGEPVSTKDNPVYKGTATGSANTYAVSITGIAGYVDGQIYLIKINAPANTGNSTLNINGLGAKTIANQSGGYITSGTLNTSYWYLMSYDSTFDHIKLISIANTTADINGQQTLLNKTLSSPTLAGDIFCSNGNMWFPKDFPATNLLPDSGRFAGKDYDPTSVVLTNAFANNDVFTPYNGSTVASGGKFIHDNTDNGGAAGSMTADAVALTNAIAALDANKSKRYGPEFYIASFTQGSGTSVSNAYIPSTYCTFLNGTGNKALGGSGSGYLTFSFWIRLKSGTAIVINKAKKLYKNGAEITDNYVGITTADGWVHIQAVIGTNGYVSTAPNVYATPGDVVQIALPVVSCGGTGVGIHTVPILRADTGSTVTASSATLLASGWVGSSAPYTQTVTIQGMTAAMNGNIGVAQSATATQRAAARSALLSITSQGTNTITVTADGSLPSIDIPIALTMIS